MHRALTASPLPLRVVGIGSYLPRRVVTSEEFDAECGIEEGWTAQHTGVLRRHRAGEGESNSVMGAHAARAALADAGIEARELGLIINASGTPEVSLPDGGPLIQRALGLADTGIPCFSIHSSCLSFINALLVAGNFLATSDIEYILVVSSEIPSVALNRKEPEGAGLLGDAAGAVVVRRSAWDEGSAIEAAHFETYGAGAFLTTVRGGGTLHPPNGPGTKPEDNLFFMDGPAVIDFAQKYGDAFLERLRPGLSTGLGSIAAVVPHQASKVGLRGFELMGWPDERVIKILHRTGNCVAASIPLALEEGVRTGKIVRGEELLLVGTGAGLSFGGLILRW